MQLDLFCVLLSILMLHHGGRGMVLKSERTSLPEENMNVTQMIKYHGYPCQIHYVLTTDGYILTLQRIPFGRTAKSKGQPVFLQHGIVDSAATWTMNSPEQSLAFVLADAGYDVWLGNSRGNTYSKSHVKYNNDDPRYWDFSFDEMASYDIPACIDYITNITKHNIHYIGHSQGTTIGFAAFSQNQKLAKKVNTFFALAPVAKVGHIKGAIEVLSTIEPEVEFLVKLFGIKEFLPSTPFLRLLATELCGSHILEAVCGNLMFLLAGFDTTNFNKTRIPVYLSHLPAGTSVKDVIHFAQMVKNDKFQMYDYGRDGNMKHYKQSDVPQYNVSNVRVPVALFSGSNDWLADPVDVENGLVKSLPNIIVNQRLDSWNHLDFVWGETAYKHVYNKIIDIMDKQLD